MCLAIPSRVIFVDKDKQELTIETMGIQKIVAADLLGEEIKQNDYVLVHAGFAIGKLNPSEAQKTIDLFQEIARAEENQ